MRIGLLGDVHGERAWMSRALDVLLASEIDAIWQLGDLGVWPSGESQKDWDKVSRRLERAGVSMFVAPGNHEDYDQIDALTPREDGWLLYRDQILLAPRGHRTEVAGLTVLWLGGAGSIDRSCRLADMAARQRERDKYRSSRPVVKTWWEQEYVTEADVERCIAGGPADIMVCHDAPHPVAGIELAQDGANTEDLRLAEESTGRLTRVVAEVQPRLLLHGHHHIRVDSTYETTGTSTRVCGFARDGMNEALGILTIPTLEVEWWDGSGVVR